MGNCLKKEITAICDHDTRLKNRKNQKSHEEKSETNKKSQVLVVKQTNLQSNLQKKNNNRHHKYPSTRWDSTMRVEFNMYKKALWNQYQFHQYPSAMMVKK